MNNIILLFRGLRVSYLQNSIQSYFDLVMYLHVNKRNIKQTEGVMPLFSFFQQQNRVVNKL